MEAVTLMGAFVLGIFWGMFVGYSIARKRYVKLTDIMRERLYNDLDTVNTKAKDMRKHLESQIEEARKELRILKESSSKFKKP